MLRFLLIACLSLLPGITLGHEFWIEPLKWQVEPGETIEAHIRVGQDMKGGALPYVPSATPRFEVVSPGGTRPVEGLIGSRPALSMPAGEAGLAVIVHVTRDYLLKYSEAEKFESFVTHKDLGDTLAQHAARGLPETGFRERYSRYAKSLVAVGAGQGEDRDMGLLTEITALANPYVDDLPEGMPVRLTYEGAPRADAQIEVFERDAEGGLGVFTVRTDGEGRAAVPVKPGHDYMLDAVVMRPLEPVEPEDPVWESLWANLTFHVPEN